MRVTLINIFAPLSTRGIITNQSHGAVSYIFMQKEEGVDGIPPPSYSMDE